MENLTKEQYLFLCDFRKQAENNSHNDPFLKFGRKSKISIEQICDLLTNHKNIFPANPFSNNPKSYDHLEGNFLIYYLDKYLEDSGLDSFIVLDKPHYYYLNQQGIMMIEKYERFEEETNLAKESNEIANKAIKKSKISNIIAIGALIIALVAIIVDIALHSFNGN